VAVTADPGALWARNQGLLRAYLARTWGPEAPDWVEDAARYGYTMACLRFDPARGRFSTLAWAAMSNAVRMEYRRRSHDATADAVSYDALPQGEDDPGHWEWPGLADPGATRDLDDAVAGIDLARTRVLRLLALGLTQRQAARVLGLSPPAVAKILRREAEWYWHGRHLPRAYRRRSKQEVREVRV